MFPALRAFVPLALFIALAVPAQAFDGAILAAGQGTIRVFDAIGQEVCTGAAAIAVSLVYEEVEHEDHHLPTGQYSSASLCATFVYPIETEYECIGSVGGPVRCDAADPPRYFTLEPDGAFLYVRDNLGIHFEVEGQLERRDV